MSSSSEESCSNNGASAAAASQNKKYKGIRRRKWGKWVSEIRVPGTPERLWLGSYATPEAAAVAHDVAYYCLRGDSSSQNLNFFPLALPSGARVGMSPRSVQKAASDAGMATDAGLLDSRNLDENEARANKNSTLGEEQSWVSRSSHWENDQECLNISVDDYL